jgi:two-component system, NarL family, nitrate/nitrite response regulator NarL
MVRAASLEDSTGGVSVLVADSTPLTAYLIAEALRRDRSLAITTAEASSVILTATALKPDVAIISEQLQGKPGKGIEVLRELRSVAPNTRTVMLLDSAERAPVVEAFRSGARGVFSRSAPLKMLTRCVHRVHEGQLWISGREVGYLLETLAQAPATRLVDSQGTMLLSEREQDVLRWLVAGLTNRAIARELKIGENTVKNYLFRIFNKLGVSSRVEVVLYAASQRWATEPYPRDGVRPAPNRISRPL